MKRLWLTLLLLALAYPGSAQQYPALETSWNISLGGDLIDIRDVDADGANEITIGLLRDQASYAYLLDGQGRLIWRNKISVIWPQNTPHTLIIEDLEGNNDTDIIVGSVVEAKSCYGQLSPYSSPLFALERNPQFENNMLKWVNRGLGISISMDVADLDDDGTNEIVSGARDGYVWAVNYDGSQRWKYKTEGAVSAIHIADMNADRRPEIIAGSFESVYALNSLGTRIWRYQTKMPVMGVHAADINNNGLMEILAAGDNDTLYLITPGGELMWEKRIEALKPPLAAADIDGDGAVEALAASGSYVHAFDSYGNIKFSHDVGYPIVNMAAAQLTENGTSQLVVVGARKITSFKINPDYVDDLSADANFNLSLVFHQNGSYALARNHALAAAETYASLGDQDSTKMALDLNGTSTMYIRANELLAYAEANYTIGDYDTAKETAIAAERIYIRLKDPELTDKALRLANSAIDQIEGGNLYAKALDYYRAKDYVQGSIYAQKALDIFEILNESGMMNKSKSLVEHSSEYPKANENYELAFKLLELGNLTLAKEYAESAKVSYEKLSDAGRISSTVTLITKIEAEIAKRDTLSKAFNLGEKAENKLGARNYQVCIEDAERSAQYYMEYSKAEEAEEVKAIGIRCSRGVEAQQFFKKANDLLIEGKQETAKDHASKARQLYRGIDDADGAIEASNFIDMIEDEQAAAREKKIREDADQKMMLIVVTAGLLILAIIGIFIYLRLSGRRKKQIKDLPPMDFSQDEDFTKLIPGYADDEAPENDLAKLVEDPEVSAADMMAALDSAEDSADALLAAMSDTGAREEETSDVPKQDIDVKVEDGKVEISVLGDDGSEAPPESADDMDALLGGDATESTDEADMADLMAQEVEKEGENPPEQDIEDLLSAGTEASTAEKEPIAEPAPETTVEPAKTEPSKGAEGASTLDQLLAGEAGEEPERPAEEDTEKKSAKSKKPRKSKEFKTAEEIKKELTEINKKLSGK